MSYTSLFLSDIVYLVEDGGKIILASKLYIMAKVFSIISFPCFFLVFMISYVCDKMSTKITICLCYILGFIVLPFFIFSLSSIYVDTKIQEVTVRELNNIQPNKPLTEVQKLIKQHYK